MAKEVRYMIPINEKVDGETQTVDIVTLTGTKKKRKKLFRKYLKERFNLTNPKEIARAMGFKDLL